MVGNAASAVIATESRGTPPDALWGAVVAVSANFAAWAADRAHLIITFAIAIQNQSSFDFAKISRSVITVSASICRDMHVLQSETWIAISSHST
jgi:hypothetical protein